MSWRVPVEARTDRTFPPPLRGRVESRVFPSQVLRGNPWGDPTDRELPVYLPPSGRIDGRPLVLLLTGYTGAGWMHFQRGNYLRESLLQRIDRLMRTGEAAEAVVVAPDCLTTLGGSQYLNSTATGRYEDYVVQEILPWVRQEYRTGPTVVCGTSSGGYGALQLAMRHPEVFQAVAADAGDLYFEYCYLPEFPIGAREIRRAGGPEKFLEGHLGNWIVGFAPDLPIVQTIEQMGYASCYSPIESEPGRFDLPYDWSTGELRPEVWDRWLAWDPVRMLEQTACQEALRQSKLVYVTAGQEDEYYLDVGARIFVERLRALGISPEFVEFEGAHPDGKTQYDRFLPRLLTSVGFPPGG